MKMKMKPHTFCSYCGVPYENEVWPRVCAHCKNTTWKNPLPVIVLIVPTSFKDAEPGRVDTYGNQLVTVRRAIKPSLGQICLPGGYIDYGETWQQAAFRELWEETGIDLRSEDEDRVRLLDVRSASNSNVLIFARTRVIRSTEIPPFVPNHECSERVILSGVELGNFKVHGGKEDSQVLKDLAFPTHTEMAKAYFRGNL